MHIDPNKIPRPREGHVFQAHSDGSGDDTTWDDIRKWAADPRRVHIVGMMPRPGVMQFCAFVEGRLFPSDTIAESAFTIHATIWHDFPWQILSVPAFALETVVPIANECGLVIRHTVPIVVEGPLGIAIDSINMQKEADPDWEWFPLKLPNVYTLESEPTPAASSRTERDRGGWG